MAALTPMRVRAGGSNRRALVIVAALMAVGTVFGTWYAGETIRRGERSTLYDFSYGPAVMLACGRDYASPATGQSAPLDAFLIGGADAFRCADLPNPIARTPLTGYQSTFRYLMWMLALTWRVTGVSWSGLAPLSGLMLGATAALAFGLLRRVANPPVAVIGAVLIMTSPLHLNYLTDVRNYPKAPILLGLGLLYALLFDRRSRAGFIGAAAAFGALLGIGVGFRQDFLILAPPFVITIALLARGPWREALWSKGLALAASGVATLVVMAPQLSAYAPGGGASVQHVATLGLMAPFDAPLGVTNDALYEWGYYNEDSFAYATLASHGNRRLGVSERMPVYGTAYDRSATAYWTEVVRTFPADLIARAYASALRLVELPSSTAFTATPSVVGGHWSAPLWRWRGDWLSATRGAWTLLGGAALAVVSLANLPLALGLGVLCLYVLGYPAIQFHERHYFCLDIVPLMAAAFLFDRALGAARGRLERPAARASVVRVVVFVAVATAGVAAPLLAARWYQARAVGDMLHAYTAAPTRPALLQDRNGEDGTIRLERASADAEDRLPQAGAATAELFVLTLGGAQCDAFTVDLTIRYRRSHANPDFTRTLHVNLSRPPDVVRVFVPVFAHRSEPGPGVPQVWYTLGGFDVPESERPCVQDVAVVADPSGFPVLVTAVLPPAWPSAERYQTLTALEQRTPIVPARYTSPPGLVVGALRIQGPFLPLPATPPSSLADVVTVDSPGAWTVRGRGRQFYLATVPGVTLTAGQLLIAEGEVHLGGLSLGLVRDGTWAAQVGVSTPGPFLVMVQVPVDGRYDVILANNLTGRFAGNDFVVTRIGVVD